MDAATDAAQPGMRVVGTRARRIEDPALLRGSGQFLDDIRIPGLLNAAFVRSPVAHARIRHIDTAAASAMPGVVGIFTARTLQPGLTRLRMPLGFPTTQFSNECTPFVLCPEEPCYVGEALAIVVAKTRAAAEDASGAVRITYDELPAVSDCRDGLAADAPAVRLESASNALVRFQVAYGEPERAFGQAAHIVRRQLKQHRGAAHPIEGRGAIARFDGAEGRLTVWSSTQMSHDLAFMLADLLGLPETHLRVIAPDVGGGFGAKFLIYPEEIAVAAAARLLGQAVKWVEDRQEHFLAAIQERDEYWDLEAAVDREGRLLGVRGTMIHDQGAYTPQGINCPYNAATSVTGPYIVPSYALDVTVAQTNKVPAIPVRGAGYPEAAFAMERLMDSIAEALGLDRAEVRARNLVPAEKMPYEKPLKSRAGVGIVLDSGDYLACQSKVLHAIDYAGFPARQAAARRAGRYLGIGIAHAVKGTGRGPFESGVVRVSPTGRVSVCTGALAMGQGLKTALAQVCAEQLGIEPEAIEVIAGDTAAVSLGIGGAASRQMVTAGTSVHLAAVQVREKALRLAAHLLEADPSDLELSGGGVRVAGTDRRVSLAEIARRLRGVSGYALPAGMDVGLEASFMWRTDQMTYANAFHACEIAVDAGTGAVSILRYVAIQDSGRLVNPLIVEGQLHGGIVHGIGNALFEQLQFDQAAQPLTVTFADYLIPTATELPAIELLVQESPSPLNPLGVKGVGEGGTIPVAPAIIGAIEHALQPWGVQIDEAPVSPVRILSLLSAARRAGAPRPDPAVV
jgi:carbon-monoxide dehydrogenase large subunit